MCTSLEVGIATLNESLLMRVMSGGARDGRPRGTGLSEAAVSSRVEPGPRPAVYDSDIEPHEQVRLMESSSCICLLMLLIVVI
jgi:hypothetical protein